MRKPASKLVYAAIVAALSAATVLSGCGGGSGVAAARGGSILGVTVDGSTGLRLGGVEVAVEVSPGVWKTATSSDLDGAFAITGVPAGVYTKLRITPNPVVFGPPREITVPIVVVAGGTVVLPGPVIVIDEFPPSPI